MLAPFIVFGGIALVIIISIFIVNHIIFMNNIYWHFEHCNTITFGPKGSGKDLVTDKVINKRDDVHYANIPYTYNDKEIIIDEFKKVCAPVNYQQLIENNFTKQPHIFIEDADIYISDMGVYFPSYMDSVLYRLYPSMPVLYALDRQLYSQNIHFNSQSLARGWKALREQADFFIYTKRTYNLPFILITRVYTYDRYDSADKRLLPIKKRLMNKYSKAEVDLFNATNGDIRTGLVIRFKPHIKYDTRYFEKKLLNGDRLTKDMLFTHTLPSNTPFINN